MVLWRLLGLGAVGAATYVLSSAAARPYFISGYNVFLPAAILLACIAGLNAVSFRKLFAEVTRRTPEWELAVKQILGPTLLQVFHACRRVAADDSPCCQIDEAATGLRVYLLGRPLDCAFGRRLTLATSFDFSNADRERWKAGEWVIGRAFTTGQQQGWRRSTDWPGLNGAGFSRSDWDERATDKMDVSYEQARSLQKYSAIIAIPIKRNRRSSARVVGVLALVINDACYPCIDEDTLGWMAVAAGGIGKLKADGTAAAG